MAVRIWWCCVALNWKTRTNKRKLEENRFWSHIKRICYPFNWKAAVGLLECQFHHCGKHLLFLFSRVHSSLFWKQWPDFLRGNNISPLRTVLVGQFIKLYYSPLIKSWTCDPGWPSQILFPRTLYLELSNMRVENGWSCLFPEQCTDQNTRYILIY